MKAKPQQDNAFLRARRALLLDHCFYGSLIMHLEETEDAEAKRGIWVDGERIGYNATALEKMDLLSGAGLLAKGVLQCALGHHLRRGVRDEKLWQDAADYVVNPEILDSGLTLPAGALIDRTYQGQSVEQVYATLEQQAQKQKQGQQGKPQAGAGGSGQTQPQAGQNSPQQGQAPGKGQDQPQQGQGQPQTGEVRDLPGKEPGQAPGEAKRSGQEQEWKIKMKQALQSAKSRGDLPGNFERFIEKELEPRVSWKAELRRWYQAQAKDNSTWARPNRRFIGQGLYLPAIHSERMGTMVVVNDTSGSTAHAQEVFFGELKAVIEDVNPEKIIYIQQDKRIQSVEEIEPGDDFKSVMRGGGGTDFRPVFDYLEAQGIDPACMVFLTDLDGPFPEQEPPFPVLWATVGERDSAPFGDVIKIDVTQN